MSASLHGEVRGESQLVLQVLSENVRGSTVSELRGQLRVRGIRLRDHEIARLLRALRTEGLVKLGRGRWSCPFSLFIQTGSGPYSRSMR